MMTCPFSHVSTAVIRDREQRRRAARACAAFAPRVAMTAHASLTVTSRNHAA